MSDDDDMMTLMICGGCEMCVSMSIYYEYKRRHAGLTVLDCVVLIGLVSFGVASVTRRCVWRGVAAPSGTFHVIQQQLETFCSHYSRVGSVHTSFRLIVQHTDSSTRISSTR